MTTETLITKYPDENPVTFDWSWIDRKVGDIGASIYGIGFIGYYENEDKAVKAVQKWIEKWGYKPGHIYRFKVQLSITVEPEPGYTNQSKFWKMLYFNGSKLELETTELS
jgi:hypothetical protein